MPLFDFHTIAAAQVFLRRFGRRPTWASRAPGRLEILGNHTDYNEGTVLSVAVDRAMHIAAAPNPDAQDGMVCRLYDAVSHSERTFRLDALDHPRKGDWANYIKGLVSALNLQGFKVPAFDAVLHGTVPLSAGMSSSAALEMAMVLILDRLADARLDWLALARAGQSCENDYIGAHTGLMDQLSSLKGRAGHLIHSDFRTLAVSNVPMPARACFVVANSMVKHNLTNEYNERRDACTKAAAILGVPALRDVTPAQLDAARPRLPAATYRRAAHVVGEIARVEAGRAALARGDLKAFGALMSESHRSSQENFENSCPEIDTLVKIGATLPGFLGARISGGGFGGISVHLVERDAAPAYQAELAKRYRAATGRDTATLIATAADGACLWRL